jgi:prepilin-type N-terminal cleavage/methylation domain-containing protein
MKAWTTRSRMSASDEGFSLIEIVVAMGLIALAFAALTSTVLAGSVAARTNGQRAAAQQAASSCLEKAIASSWASLTVGTTACPTVGRVTGSRTVSMHHGTAYDDKLVVVTSSYAYGGRTRTVTVSGLRAPRLDEVSPPTHTSGVITAAISYTPAPTVSPASAQLASTGALNQAVTLTAHTSVAADLVTVGFTAIAGPQTVSLVPDAAYTTWTLVLDSSSPYTFNSTSSEVYTFRAVAGNAAAATATASNTLLAYATPPAVTLSANASPSTMQLDAAHYLTAPVTLQATTSAAAASASVTFTVNGASVTRSLTPGTGNTSWSLTLSAGSASGTFAAPSDTFTFVATTSTGATTSPQSATIGFSYPLGAVSVGTYVLGGEPGSVGGHLCTHSNGASTNKLFVAQTLSFKVTNGGTAPTVAATWTNPNGTATSITGPTANADGTATYVVNVPSGTTFTGATGAFTISVRRSDGAQNSDPAFSVAVSTTNNSNSCA